jgi:hypothetical protein
MLRLDRGIQYAAAYRSITIVSEYWIARSSRVMTAYSWRYGRPTKKPALIAPAF